MATKETEQDLIQSRQGVCGGAPCIQGTRIPVWAIVESTQRGLSEQELQNYFTTTLTQTEIRGALNYYHEHLEQIENDIRVNQEAQN